MVVVAILLGLAGLAYVLLWLSDNPDANPYELNRLYRHVIAVLVALVLAGAFGSLKGWEWYRDMRRLVVDVRRVVLERCP